MKVFVILAACVALAAAASISKDAVPIQELPQWQLEHPEMTKILQSIKSSASPAPRIIGGQPATQGQFPYTVVVNINLAVGAGLCGGSLIHTNWVLTAAHCLDLVGLQNVEIFLGATRRDQPNEPGQIRFIATDRILHEQYDGSNFNNDIAVLQIPTAPLSAFIQIVGLAFDLENTFAGEQATVSGWGRTTDTGAASQELNHVTVSVITNVQCALTFGNIVIASTVCTAAATCNGDSGGPLVIDNQQIGVVSFGAAASCSGFPSGYGRVSHFRDWIRTATGGVV